MIRFLFPVLLGVIFVSCTKESLKEDTYIVYSLEGGSCEGIFQIKPDGDLQFREAWATYAPMTEDGPGAVLLNYQDLSANQVIFAFPIVTTEQPFELDSELEIVTIHTLSECLLFEHLGGAGGGFIIEVHEIKLGTGLFGLPTVEFLKVDFSGHMVFNDGVSGMEIHRIEGALVYNSDDVF